jgi:hypothetical protein
VNAARASAQLAVRTHSPTIALDAAEGDAGDGDAAAVCAGMETETPAEVGRSWFLWSARHHSQRG